MGTPEFSIPTLKMVNENFNLKAVFTQSPKRANRGMSFKKSPVQHYAEKFGIKVFYPDTLKKKKIERQIKLIKPDYLVVVAYGLILPANILEIPKFGAINGHASLLPKWRGASPIQRSIESGDRETGCTSMLMDDGLDTGPILLQKKLKIENEDNTLLIHDKLSKLTSICLLETLEKFTLGKINPIFQDHHNASYAKKLIKGEGIINWGLTSKEVYNKLRAFQPFPGLFTTFNSQELKIIDGEIINQKHDSSPGTILSIDNSIIVACGERTSFLISIIQKSGKKKLRTNEFLRGFNLQKGDVFG